MLPQVFQNSRIYLNSVLMYIGLAAVYTPPTFFKLISMDRSYLQAKGHKLKVTTQRAKKI